MGQAARSLRRYVQNVNVESRARRLVERTETGSRPAVRPPSAEADDERLRRARGDKLLHQEVHGKRAELVQRVDGITINVSEPAARSSFGRRGGLPTRDTEHWAAMQPDPEYKIPMPPPHTIPKGKLSFREALELLSAAVEHRLNASDEAAAKTLREHAAVSRVGKPALDNMHRYFQTFESMGAMTMRVKREHETILELEKGEHGMIDKEKVGRIAGRARLVAQEKIESEKEYEATVAYLDREKVKMERRARTRLGDTAAASGRPTLRGPHDADAASGAAAPAPRPVAIGSQRQRHGAADGAQGGRTASSQSHSAPDPSDRASHGDSNSISSPHGDVDERRRAKRVPVDDFLHKRRSSSD